MPSREPRYVTLSDRTYKIGYIDASVGALLIRKMIGLASGDPARAISMFLGGMPIEDEMFMQKHLLSVIAYEQTVGDKANYLPIANGSKILLPDLDAATVVALQQASFELNIAPFFLEKGQSDWKTALDQISSITSSS